MRLLKEIRNYVGNYPVKSGVFHFHRNEFKQAVEFLGRALREGEELDDHDRGYARVYLTLSLLGLAERAAARGEIAAAIDELARAAATSPSFPDIHHRRGVLLEQAGRIDEAIACHGQALALNPDYLEAHVALGFCLLGAGRTEEAGLAFAQALEVRIEQIRRPFRTGLARLEANDPAASAIAFHQAFRALPQAAQELLNRALDWMREEEHEKALAELDRAIELNPHFPDLHNFRGISLSELERVDEAVAAFRQAAALRPEHLPPRLNLAFCLLRDGREEAATAELEAILDDHPGEPIATAKLAELLRGRQGERKRGSRGDPA